MADQNVNVKIRVTKTGTGAQDTVNDLKRIQAQAGGVGSSLKSALGGMGATFGVLGLAAGAAAVVKFGRDTVMAASAANESLNKMRVVFGASSSAITKFSQNSSRALGMSKTQAIEAAGTFGNLFTSMGLGQAASASMSQGIVQLAADLGSFNNIPIDVMLEKMRSGMVGEVEPLRAVGINLSAAAVKAKALQMGLADANGEVSQAAILQARYAVMLDQSKNAQGDFARTADGLANSLKIADAEVANLKVQLGELTIRPYTAVVHVVAEGLSDVNDAIAYLTDPNVRAEAQVVVEDSRLQAALNDLQRAQAGLAKVKAESAGAWDADLIAAWEGEVTRATAAVNAASAQLAVVKANADNGTASMLALGSSAAFAASQIMLVSANAQTLSQYDLGAALDTGNWRSAYGTAMQKSQQMVVQEARDSVVEAYDAAKVAELERIRLTESAAERAADALEAKWSAFASTVTTALDGAINKARGLFDLGGGGGAGGIITEPGKGGPFEALYRITDIAATMAGRAPGADTARWQQMYAGQDAMGIARNFQQGNLMAPGVFENIDWNMLGQQAVQQQNASKISTYAGQAVANLTQAGKPLTAEAITAEIDKLAEKDKANLVPELQNIAKSVTDTGVTAHTDAASVVASIDAMASKLGGAPPTPVKGPPPQTIPLFAAGTSYAPGGLAIVGERGPELVRLPQGSRVYNTAQTSNMMAGSGGSAASFMTELAKALTTKVTTAQQAGATLADMLVNAAAVNVQTNMLQQLSRR